MNPQNSFLSAFSLLLPSIPNNSTIGLVGTFPSSFTTLLQTSLFCRVVSPPLSSYSCNSILWDATKETETSIEEISTALAPSGVLWVYSLTPDTVLPSLAEISLPMDISRANLSAHTHIGSAPLPSISADHTKLSSLLADALSLLAKQDARTEALREDNSLYAQQAEKQFSELLSLQSQLTHVSQLHAQVVNSPTWKASWPLRATTNFVKKHLGAKTKNSTPPIINHTNETERPLTPKTPPLVSVIVPNYNHAPYLRQRLESIYHQTYSNFEVLLMDDASTDESRIILQEYANRYRDNTTLLFNDVNSGSVFSQWQKGLQTAKGQLIWIAESDDWCTTNFLTELVPQFYYESVQIAFSNSIFVQDEHQTRTLSEYLQDLPELNMESPFRIPGYQAVQRGFAQKNIIPNVSSVLMRNIGTIPQEVKDLWQQLQLSGDWLLYLSMLRGGTLAYTNTATNYYRIHQKSTSLKVQHTPAYYTEYEQISRYIARNYPVSQQLFEDVLTLLCKHYRIMQKTEDDAIVAQYYHPKEIMKEAALRKPNVLMGTFSLQVGGGETVPLHLAAEMKKQGFGITLLNFGLGQYDPRVRDTLPQNVPLFTLSSPKELGRVLSDFGTEIVHTHHGTIDSMAAESITSSSLQCQHVISLHGMYEAIGQEMLQPILLQVAKTCRTFIYLTDKNLLPFQNQPGFSQIPFIKMRNGLPILPLHPVSRAALNIPKDAFVLCIATRAIPQKGWAEAIEAVTIASTLTTRPIHLILLGEGEMLQKLQPSAPSNIHFLGMQNNVRDYLSAGDMALFPSYYEGESYPLFLVESFLCGKPVITTDIGEIRSMMTASNGELAGYVLPLQEKKVPVQTMAKLIAQTADDKNLYTQLVKTTKAIAPSFNISTTVQEYEHIYSALLAK